MIDGIARGSRYEARDGTRLLTHHEMQMHILPTPERKKSCHTPEFEKRKEKTCRRKKKCAVTADAADWPSVIGVRAMRRTRRGGSSLAHPPREPPTPVWRLSFLASSSCQDSGGFWKKTRTFSRPGIRRPRALSHFIIVSGLWVSLCEQIKTETGVRDGHSRKEEAGVDALGIVLYQRDAVAWRHRVWSLGSESNSGRASEECAPFQIERAIINMSA